MEAKEVAQNESIELWDALGGTCPCSHAVRVALNEKGVSYHHRAEARTTHPFRVPANYVIDRLRAG